MRALLVGLIFVAAACDTTETLAPPGQTTLQGVTLRAESSEVRRGESVALSLVNDSGRVVETGVFGCDRIERWEDDAWVQREDDNDRACILPLYTIPSGESYDGAFTFDVSPGTVRLVHTFAFRGAERSEIIYSPSIRVLR